MYSQQNRLSVARHLICQQHCRRPIVSTENRQPVEIGVERRQLAGASAGIDKFTVEAGSGPPSATHW